MADTKISDLPAATTPLAGTELVEVVQDGANKKVAASELGGGGVDTTDPTAVRSYSDDFIFGSTETGEVGEMGWHFTNGTVANAATSSNHPGVLRRTSGTTANQIASMNAAAAVTANLMRFDAFLEQTWIVMPVSSDSEATVRLGIAENPTSANGGAHGAYIERLNTDTQWFAVTRALSSSTRVALGTYAQGQWAKFQIRRIDGSMVGFSMNGGTEVVITDNMPVPNAGMYPMTQIISSTTTARAIDIDFFSMKTTAPTR